MCVWLVIACLLYVNEVLVNKYTVHVILIKTPLKIITDLGWHIAN
jgi:hypothetical protein